jgi:hypothetical protein
MRGKQKVVKKRKEENRTTGNTIIFRTSPELHHHKPLVFHFHQFTLQEFVIVTKEKTTVWVKQNVSFVQQNGSVIKIEQN